MEESISIFEILKSYQVIISSAIAIGSTFFIVRGNRKTAAMTNAANIIREMSKDDDLKDGITAINQWDSNGVGDGIEKLASSKCKEDYKDIKSKIVYVLNQYEHLAVGINNGIYSEEIVKQNSYGTVVNIISTTMPMIQKVRSISRRNTIWQEIECLANKWEQTPLKPKKK